MKAIYIHKYIHPNFVEVHNDVVCVREIPITVTNYKGETFIVGHKREFKCNCCGETWVENINSPQIIEDNTIIYDKRHFGGRDRMNCTEFKKIKRI